MQATTRLIVPKDMRVNVTLDMSVEEMDAILAATKDIDRWPLWELKQCLSQALGKARAAYSSEHVHPPGGSDA